NSRRILAARDAPAGERFLVLSPRFPDTDSVTWSLLETLRREHPWARITLGCWMPAVDAPGERPGVERLFDLGVEVEVRTDGWSSWLAGRRFHYDAVFGAAPALEELIRRTQPQAERR